MRSICLLTLAALSMACACGSVAKAQDKVMGQILFDSPTKVAKTSGVWIDGQYVGYVGELKGGNRLRLLPGDHDLAVRQAGYIDFVQRLPVEPRSVLVVHVKMEKDSRFRYPDPKTSSEVRLDIQPSRAAVFLDDVYVGNVDEFYGIRHAMLVTPGKHRFKVALPGFKTFETEMELLPRQKFALKTELVAGSINDADPIIRSEAPSTAATATGSAPTTR